MTPPERARAPLGRAVAPSSAEQSETTRGAERRAHIRARDRGVSRPLYALVRILVAPFLRLWFRANISGAENIPAEGAAIIAANHRSFLDAFFIALGTRRHLRSMAKAELFRGTRGWLFVRLGAFPVRRGQADAEALETARVILGQSGLVAVFPEGTRVDEPDALGSPHHGAGRLALETRAPIVPAAITGTSRLWLGPIPKPRRVRVAFLPPVDVVDAPSARDALSELIDKQEWPAVQREYGHLLAMPGLIAAALAAGASVDSWPAGSARREASRGSWASSSPATCGERRRGADRWIACGRPGGAETRPACRVVGAGVTTLTRQPSASRTSASRRLIPNPGWRGWSRRGREWGAEGGVALQRRPWRSRARHPRRPCDCTLCADRRLPALAGGSAAGSLSWRSPAADQRRRADRAGGLPDVPGHHQRSALFWRWPAGGSRTRSPTCPSGPATTSGCARWRH